MSTKMTWRINSDSSEATENYAEKLGGRLKGGELIELISDLGGGKTTFTRGLARGIESTNHVSSPTFTISKVYKGKKLTIHHFDFYRLNEPGLIENELADLIGDDNFVVVVEWPGVVEGILPESRVSISLKNLGGDSRQIKLKCPEELEYLRG